jgi:hypothetical protein
MKSSLCTKHRAPWMASTKGTIGSIVHGHNEARFQDNPVTNAEEGDTSRPAPWYDCSGKQPGNYEHPRDCTRFITCDAGLQAIEFDCGECSNRPEACTPQNRLVYNVTVDQCLWADQTECHIPGGDDGGDDNDDGDDDDDDDDGDDKDDLSRRRWTLAKLQQYIDL